MNQEQFDWFHNEHGLSLTESEFQDIVWFINGDLDKENRELREKLEEVKVENKHLRACAQMAIDAGRSLIEAERLLKDVVKVDG